MDTPERYRNEEDPKMRLEALSLAKDIALNVVLNPAERELVRAAFIEITAKLKEKCGFDKIGE
jgi:hypothetical protein